MNIKYLGVLLTALLAAIQPATASGLSKTEAAVLGTVAGWFLGRASTSHHHHRGGYDSYGHGVPISRAAARCEQRWQDAYQRQRDCEATNRVTRRHGGSHTRSCQLVEPRC